MDKSIQAFGFNGSNPQHGEKELFNVSAKPEDPIFVEVPLRMLN